MKRIFLIDDHPMLREGLASIITRHSDFEVCGVAATAAEAVAAVGEAAPDLVMMDISLPDKSGLELIKDLLALHPTLPVLVFSMHDEALYAERVMRAGAKGYLMKGAPAEELMHAIDRVLGGEIYLSSNVTKHILKNLSAKTTTGHFGMERLTDRELEVFELIGRGRSNSQISERLHISPKTVDAHRSNIKVKLALHDAPALMREAVMWVELASKNKPVASLEG